MVVLIYSYSKTMEKQREIGLLIHIDGMKYNKVMYKSYLSSKYSLGLFTSI